ncbi:MAG: type I restriction enzyme HsdR N-terminal domain-containing protein [Bacteroidales bacterium]|nr:type I restriction enzyme HsdR N-terminal domain-containing protein [Bacteroidales bacterium]
MQKLNLPEYNFNIKLNNNKLEIFDSIRKKFVALTPEEWVRQNFIMYLINKKHFPASLIAVEKKLIFNNMTRRTDIVLYNKNGSPKLIVECKSTDIKINQKVFDQIARYNMTLKVNYLVVTNGLEHYCCYIDDKNKTYNFLEEIPDYKNIID